MSLWTGAARSVLGAQDARAVDSTRVAALTVVVRAVDARGTRALRGVLVSVDGARSGFARTDEQGRVRFADRPLGAYVIRVEVLGFAPVEERVELTVGGRFELPVELVASAQRLPEVVRTARRSDVPGLEGRRVNARGHIFDRQSIDSLAPRRTSDLLRRVPSVRLVASGSGFVPRTRRAGGLSDCPMSVYLDGVQLDDERGAPPAPPIGQPARGGRTAPPSVIDGVSVDLLDAVEVYVGASEIPSQFNQAGGSCGVIALWTRARR